MNKESQYIFNDGQIKSRLNRVAKDWFVAEYKSSNGNEDWFPWFCGTKEFLAMTDLDLEWARDKRKTKH